MNKTDNLPGRMMALQLKDKHLLYNSYMAFFEHGGEVLLALELAEHPDKKFLRTQVAWINPARTSANRPKGIGLAFSNDEISAQTKSQIEAELGSLLKNDRTTFTL